MVTGHRNSKQNQDENKFDLTFLDISLIVFSIFGLELICFVFTRLLDVENFNKNLLFAYFVSIGYIGIPIIYARFKNKSYFNRIVFLNKSRNFVRNCLIGILIGFVLAIVFRLTPYWALIHPDDYTAPKFKYGFLGVLLFPMSIFGFQLIVLGPIGEEVLNRGIIYNYFKNHMNVWLALFVQAFIFAVMNFTVASQHKFYDFLFYSIIGFVLGFLYEKTSTLITSIVCHSVFYYVIQFFIINWQ
jgi:membrane protease YdiL (CAAX protease family)